MFSRILAATAAQPENIDDSIRFVQKLSQQLAAWFDAQKANLLLAAVVAALGVCAAVVMWYIFARVLKGIFGRFSDVAGRIFAKLGAPAAWATLLIGLSWSNRMVDLPGQLDRLLDKLFYSFFILVFVWGVLRVVGACDEHFAAKRAQDPDSGMDKLVADLIRRAVKTVVWIVTILFVAQNIFRFNVTALITGAGVAGLAIAFAAQNTIANIFGALSIVLDKIFKVGDFIDVGGKRGTVEGVGFRSTKLRSLDGTLWNLPNRVVADAAIENISMRKNIKFMFTLNLVYSTTPEQMQQALDILKDIFGSYAGFDQQNAPAKFSFTAFSSSSLDIGVIVWFNTRDFMEAQGMKQELNLMILERFNAAGLSFAYPSVTNYIVEKK
ncbi:MAG: mechanosensitive ion channel family protein [Lentisphaeria bacterium]|nr:mechanosensitive ion channel family protein [Lentisphaeria bacterium]